MRHPSLSSRSLALQQAGRPWQRAATEQPKVRGGEDSEILAPCRQPGRTDLRTDGPAQPERPISGLRRHGGGLGGSPTLHRATTGTITGIGLASVLQSSSIRVI